MNTNTGDPRRALQVALARRDAAQAALRQAEAAHQRAVQMREQAEDAAAKLGDIDTREARAIADAIRRGIAPELPKALREAKGAKAKADEQTRLANAAERTLLADAELARARFTDAEAVAEQAAAAVQVAKADADARTLHDLENRARELRARLLGVSRVWLPVNGKPAPLPLSAKVRTLLSNPPANSLAVADQGWQAAWQAWGRALLADAQAPAPQEPASTQPAPVLAVEPWERHRLALAEAARERQQRVEAEAEVSR